MTRRQRHHRVVTGVLAVALLLGILNHAPWRLMALAVETFVVDEGYVRISQADDHYWRCLDLAARLERLGWTVTYEPLSASYFGVTDPHDHTIRINETLHWNARLATLAHEAGHVFQPARLTQNQSEMYAESVAALVAHDGLREHARYLATLKGDLVTMIMYWPDIYNVAGMLTHS